MKIKLSNIMKVKTSYSSQRETVVTSSFRACSLAMDDGGRCLLDVINDPKLLQSFLESGSDENSKDPQDGTSSESAVGSPQVSNSQVSLANHIPSVDHIIDAGDQMGYSFAVDGPALLAQSGVGSTTATLGGMPLVVASTGPQTYQHASSSGATIHHLPSTVNVNLHPHSPASARSVTPSHNIKSPSMGPSSVHSMPPPSPLQQIRSPLPSHTPSPAPAWSPVPPVLSPAAPRSQSMPSMSVAFQQTHNQMLQTTCNIAQYVTALTSPQSVQKITLQQQQQQQQQQVFLQQQLPPASQQQSIPRLTAVQTPVVTTVAVPAPMLHLIQAQASNVGVSTTRTSHNNVRSIQPKIPNIRPKPPACSASNQFVSPVPTPKQTSSTSVSTGQRTVGVGIQPGTAPLVLNQAPPGVFSGAAPGTILVNQIIPGVPQSGGPILISGNLPSLLLRPTNPSAGQTLNATNSSNNATLIATALQNPNQQTLFAPAKQTIHSPQTIVIPNNNLHPGLASQNLNLTTAAIPNSGILSSSSQGQSFLARPNFIFSSTRLMGNQSLQLQQIQTASGPILALAPAPGQALTLPQLQALSNAQLAPVTAVPMQTVMTSQGVLSLQSHAPQSALQQQQQQSLFGTPVPFTNHLEQSSHQVMQVPQPLTPNQVQTNHPSHLQQNQPQQIEHSPKPSSPQKPTKAPQLNLEELLKEHGIVPDSPVPSPECNSPIIEEPVPQTIVNSPQLITALQPSQQVVLEQSGSAALPQLKLSQDCNVKLCNVAIVQEGSVILHPQSTPNNPTVQHFVSSGQIQGRTVNTTVNSMIFPTAVVSSAASVPVSTESAPRNHSTLIARLNAAPALSVPDVSSLALSTVAGTTTLSTSNSTTLVPLVQSLSVTNTPIASSYIVQRTNTLSSAGDRVFVTEDVHTTQSHVTPVISSSSSTQNVQNRVNHSGPFQTIVVPNEHTIRTMPQIPPKTVQSSHVGTVSTTTSPSIQPVVQKVGHKETRVTEVDNSAVVPSHNNPATSSNVPNNVILSKIQKEINELTNVRIRCAEQQKILQQLTVARLKLLSMQNKNRGNRVNQNQYQLKIENEVEKLIQRAQASHSIRSVSPQQLQLKPPVLNVQQSGQLEKQQNSKSLNSHNLQLVNLLKQNPPHNAPPKHTVHVTTTTVTAACDSTTTTVESSVSVHQKSNQVLAPVQPKLQNSHNQSVKTSNEVTQQQVIVRLQKPQVQQQYVVQSSSNVVQRKAPSPAKRVINTVYIHERLKKDQNNALNPDVNTPFSSKWDACSRLLNYHVFNSQEQEPSEQQLQEDDRAFAAQSEHMMQKIKLLFGNFFSCRSKNSCYPKSETPSHEAVQIQRLLIDEEQEALDAEKAIVAEGGTINIPPARQIWLEQMRCPPSPVNDDFCEESNEQDDRDCSSPSSEQDNFTERVAEQEIIQNSPSPVHAFSEKGRCIYDQDDNDCLCREASDHPEDSDPSFKEDDNLEAPVIDSCEDIVVPPNDNVERSPPTLKRIVIKPTRHNESDSEDQSPIRKRVKFNNSVVTNLTSQKFLNTVKPVLSDYNPMHRSEVTKQTDFVLNKTNHKVPPMSGPFQSDNRIGDMVTELRKEFNMSPMEMDDETPVGSHMVDFDPPGGVNHLVDFDPPVPRTEESCDSNLLYNSVRNNCSVNFNLLNDWPDEYVHQPNESDLAVSSILPNQENPDLDLSGLDGLEVHLNESQHCIPNGIQDVETSVENEIDYIGYSIPKHQKRFQDSSMQPASNCSGTRDQVQCAIRSITEADSRYDRVHTHTDFISLNRHSQNAHIGGYGSGTSSSIGTTRRRQRDVDEAVNSILM